MNVVPAGAPKGPASASTAVSPKDMATCTPPATVDVLGRVFDLDDGEWIGASWTVAVKLGGGCSDGIQIITIAFIHYIKVLLTKQTPFLGQAIKHFGSQIKICREGKAITVLPIYRGNNILFC